MTFASSNVLWLAAAAMFAFSVQAARAQAPQAGVAPANSQVSLDAATEAGGMQSPVMDDAVYTHALLEQFEGRWNGRDEQFRYDGQFWSGTDLTKVWIKSEGLVDAESRFTDGQHEVLLDRAVSPYFDIQGGVRVDLDNATTRTWGAFGIQGMSLYFIDVEATGYVSGRGRFAARFKASYDLLLTQRLILQPEGEMNVYGKSDETRGIGSGISDLDAGLRLRYEITRKFAPYVGVSYTGGFFQASDIARLSGRAADEVRFAFGVRTWF